MSVKFTLTIALVVSMLALNFTKVTAMDINISVWKIENNPHSVLGNYSKVVSSGDTTDVVNEELEKDLFVQMDSFMDYDLSKQIFFSESEIHIMLDQTGLQSYEDYFYEIDKEGKSNVLFFMALCALESGWGKSKIAVDKNNLCGFGSYDYKPYESSKSFDNVGVGLNYVSNFIYTKYLSEGGTYYSGKTLKDVNRKYASDKEWCYKIDSIMLSLCEKLNKEV